MREWNILFVCLGNICRSPAAEEIMRQKCLKKLSDQKVFCDSAGTSGHHRGQLSDRRMRDHAHKRGLLLQHRSRPLEAGDFDIFDRMFVMDQRNLQDVTTMAKHENKKDALKKIFMCTAFSEKYAMQDIPDPYYQGDEGFELVLDMLDEACECIILSLAAV